MAKKRQSRLKNGEASKLKSGDLSSGKKDSRGQRAQGKKAHYEELLDLARNTKDFNERKALITKAREAKAEYEKKGGGSPAQRKAWKALQRFKWQREKEKW